MGGARFLLYPSFIFLTAWQWPERGSCSRLGLLIFLTARPWAERGSCSTLGLFFLTARQGASTVLALPLVYFFLAERGSCSTLGIFFFWPSAVLALRLIYFF